MRQTVVLAALASLLLLGAAQSSGKVSITLPPPRGEFKEGAGAALARGRCLECHSADYVYMQPPLSKQAWTAEINKMRNVYGMTIGDDEVDPLATYLTAQNGPPQGK